MRPDIFDTNKSAGFNTTKLQVYYGPKATDPETGEWQFTITKNGKEVFSLLNSELLLVANGEGPKDMLIAGLALYLAR